MATLEEIENDLTLMELADEAKKRFQSVDAHQALLRTRMQTWHHWYAPLYGDQWPEDRSKRPDAVHMTIPVIQAVVDTDTRLESLQPRLTAMGATDDIATRQKVQAGEKLIKTYLTLSGWEDWLFTLNQTRAIYARGFMRPFWNKDGGPDGQGRPDVEVLEQPGNLRIGWGTNDFRVIDWTIYEFTVSPTEAKRRWKDIEILPPQRNGEPVSIFRNGTHADPLDTMPSVAAMGGSDIRLRPAGYTPSDYERKQLNVWDYWYLDEDSKVYNAILLEGIVVDGPHEHPEYPRIPYIPVEFDHEPGSPDGIGIIQGLIDLNYEINRATSHLVQLVKDEIDPAWQVNSDSFQAGMVPKGGEIIPTGSEGAKIAPIEKPVNQVAVENLITSLYTDVHFITGMADILFGISPGTRMPGRSLELQIESANNRIEQRRQRLYRALGELFDFWTYMLKKVQPTANVTFAADDGTEQVEKVTLDVLVNDIVRWRFTTPPITPQDMAALVTRLANQLTARLTSLEDAMDELGVENPIEMLQKIEAEHMNPRLYPGDTQAGLAAFSEMLQIAQQSQSMGIQVPGMPSMPAAPGGGQDQGADQMQAGAQAQATADAQQRQPQLGQQENQSVPQPATAAGSPPPPGAAAPQGFQNQTLIRARPNGQSQALQQIRLTNGK